MHRLKRQEEHGDQMQRMSNGAKKIRGAQEKGRKHKKRMMRMMMRRDRIELRRNAVKQKSSTLSWEEEQENCAVRQQLDSREESKADGTARTLLALPFLKRLIKEK